MWYARTIDGNVRRDFRYVVCADAKNCDPKNTKLHFILWA